MLWVPVSIVRSFFMATDVKGRASFNIDPNTLSFERKKYYITRNLEVNKNRPGYNWELTIAIIISHVI